MSKRFIITNLVVQEDKVLIFDEQVNHINALRYKVGDKIYLNDYEVEILHISKEKLEGLIIGKMPQRGIPNIDVTLIQSYLKADKMEYVTQKAVELGVKTILPVISQNTVVKFKEDDKLKKQIRLEKIVKEALQQCGRTDSVNVECIQMLKNIDFSRYDAVLICHELSTTSLKNVLNNIKKNNNVHKIAVVIGPEGGLDNLEVKNLIDLENAYDISLGDRILRAETASLSILSILSYELE